MRAGTGSSGDVGLGRLPRVAVAPSVAVALSVGVALSIAVAACGPAETGRTDERPDAADTASLADSPTMGDTATMGDTVDADSPADGASASEPSALDLVREPWRAIGTEPFWGLEVSSEAIVFTEPAEEPLAFPPAEPRVESGAAVLSTSLDERLLQVTVRDTTCSDGMSDRVYAYSARVVLDGESLAGCALPDSTPAMRLDPTAERK